MNKKILTNILVVLNVGLLCIGYFYGLHWVFNDKQDYADHLCLSKYSTYRAEYPKDVVFCEVDGKWIVGEDNG